jgi:2-succinyl-5-enolpyruvyl-6-hydroxy-3-cyclohexene-1-carboxylate synthase
VNLDFRNINTLWASILVETLSLLGAKTAIISPGSRSGPLAYAFATHPKIKAISVLDERSAAFLALGIAKYTHLPTPVICSSGTAGSHFYPAVIEARESRVPLLLLTADRPPELRECHAGQTINQVNLYGHFPNWQLDLMPPQSDPFSLQYLRQSIRHAWERCLYPVAGAVHLNLPFRDPLAPIEDPEILALKSQLDPDTFFERGAPQKRIFLQQGIPLAHWKTCQRGVIIAGPAQPSDPESYCRAVGILSQTLGWPVLAEGLSPLRNYQDLNPYLIATYDLILRHSDIASQLRPEQVIRLGSLPTSKELQRWLQESSPLEWILDQGYTNLDPLHSRVTVIHTAIEDLRQDSDLHPLDHSDLKYLQLWLDHETQMRQKINHHLDPIAHLFEGKVAWILPQILPDTIPIFISNSMPVRDVERFWLPNQRRIQVFCNRGANGIDGILSASLGIALSSQKPTVLLTGDLALLHDTNGFLLQAHFQGSLTIVLINNQGGGIFESLPIAQFDPPFETFFATPQKISFANLCQTYNVEYHLIQTWSELQIHLSTWPVASIRVLEIPTDRKADTLLRQHLLRLGIL